MAIGTPGTPQTSLASEEARLEAMSVEQMADNWDFVQGVLERSAAAEAR